MLLKALAQELNEAGFPTAEYDGFYKCIDLNTPIFDSIITADPPEITLTTFCSTAGYAQYPAGSIKVDINDPESIDKIIKCLKNLKS